MVKPLPVAHLHDFTLEIFHSGVGAAVLAALPWIGWSVHVGQKRDFINPQGVDDDMHMDIACLLYTSYDIHELVTEEYLSKILWELTEEHKELLFLRSLIHI